MARRRGLRGGRGYNSFKTRAIRQTESAEDTLTSFTLQDEPHHTSQVSHRNWPETSSLRLRPVTFVSSGFSQPLEFLDTRPESESVSHTLTDMANTSPAYMRPESSSGSPLNESDNGARVLPSSDTRPEIDALSPPKTCGVSASSTGNRYNSEYRENVYQENQTRIQEKDIEVFASESDSSEDILLFRGRNKVGIGVCSWLPDTDIEAKSGIATKATKTRISKMQRKKMVAQHGGLLSSQQSDEDIKDYIDNIRGQGEDKMFLLMRGINERHLGVDSDFDFGLGEETDAEDNAQEDIPEAPMRSDFTYARLLTQATSEDDHQRLSPGKEAPFAEVATAWQMDNGWDSDIGEWLDSRRYLSKKSDGLTSSPGIDSELEGVMQATSLRVQQTRADKRRLREESRGKGLLGNKNDPDSLNLNYPNAMTMDDIRTEFKSFLESQKLEIKFPPLDNNARKVIHGLAAKFNAKSKSHGKGDQRFPVIYRTSSTSKFSLNIFNHFIGRFHRNTFTRSDTKFKHTQHEHLYSSNGLKVKLRDGEVVGASLPELGSNNRGRAMLEKMGWSSGTALGAANNKGILTPVSHVIKRSKAGLGTTTSFS